MNTVFILFYSIISSFSEGAFILTFNNRDPDHYVNENRYSENHPHAYGIRYNGRVKYSKKRVDLSFTTSRTVEPLEKEYKSIKKHHSSPNTTAQHKAVYYRVVANTAHEEKVLKMGSGKFFANDSPALQQEYINKETRTSRDYEGTARKMSMSGAFRHEHILPTKSHISPAPIANVKGELDQEDEQLKSATIKFPRNMAHELYIKLAEKIRKFKQDELRISSDREREKKNTRQRLSPLDKPIPIHDPEMTKSQEKIIFKSKRHDFERYDDILFEKTNDKPDSPYPNGAHAPDDTSIADTMYNSVRILCYVLTEPENHNTTLYPIKETWGRRCNKLLFMSTVEDPRIPTVKLHVTSELYKSWQKVMAAYLYVHDKYLNDYDWFLRADDDAFIIVENIRYLLGWFSPDDLIYFGCRFRAYGGQQLKDGHGPGMVLSRAALRAVVGGIRGKACKRFKFSDPVGEEFGICLNRVGVQKVYTRDASGGHRFLPAAPEDHVAPIAPIAGGPNFWYWMDTHYPVSQGTSCCSDYAIAFHNITPVNMYGLEYLIYRLRPFGIKFNSAKLPFSSTQKTPVVTVTSKPKKIAMPKTYALKDLSQDYADEINGIDPTDERTDTTTTDDLGLLTIQPFPKLEFALDDLYEVNTFDRKRTLGKKRKLGHRRSRVLY